MGLFETHEQLSAYDRGLRVAVGGLLPTLVTPSSIDARANTLNALYLALRDDVQRSTVSDAFKSSYVELFDNWQRFFASVSWWDEFFTAPDVSAQIDQWDERYRGALAEFRALGGSAGPATTPGSPDPESPAGGGGSPVPAAWRPWVIGGAVIVGLFAAGSLVRAIKM